MMMIFRQHALPAHPFAPHAIEVYRSSARRQRRALLWVIAALVVIDLGLVVGFLHKFGELAS